MNHHIHHHSILHSIPSDQKTNFTPKKIWQWANTHEIHWTDHVSHHPEAAGLTESGMAL